MASIQETIDFDGDGMFSGKDLDVSWAYLQIKALLDTGTSDITSDNFRDKVIEQYNLNKTNNIAEANALDVKSLPGMLSLGLPKGIDQINFQKKWTMDDMFNTHQANSSRGGSKPTDLWESIDGKIGGTIENVSWTGKTTDKDPFTIYKNEAKITLDDESCVRSDKSWTLHFRIKSRNFKGIAFRKGGDESKAWHKTTNPFFQVKTLAGNMGVYTSAGITNWFKYPDNMKSWNFANKDIDFYFVREGQNVRMFIDANAGAGPRECMQSIPGALPELVAMKDLAAPLIFSGSYMKTMSDAWIADNEFKSDDVPYLSKPTNKYRFKHDLALETSWFSWKNLFQDPFGNYGEIYNRPGKSNAAYQDHWTTTNANDGTHFGYVPRARCLKLAKNGNKTEYMSVNNVNFGSNFTVSFWVRTDSTSKFLQFKGQDASFELLQISSKTKFKFKYDGKSKEIASSTLGGKPLVDNWYHITLVKNRNLIGMWINDNMDDNNWVGIGNNTIDKIGYSTLQLIGSGSGNYYSDLRVLDYAMCNVPASGYGKKSTYSFIDKLKEGQDISGSGLSY